MKKTIFFLAMLFVSAIVWAVKPTPAALAPTPSPQEEENRTAPRIYYTGNDEPAAMGVFDVANAVEIDGVHYAVGSTQLAVGSEQSAADSTQTQAPKGEKAMNNEQ
jgi:hypothetical protein